MNNSVPSQKTDEQFVKRNERRQDTIHKNPFFLKKNLEKNDMLTSIQENSYGLGDALRWFGGVTGFPLSTGVSTLVETPLKDLGVIIPFAAMENKHDLQNHLVTTV